MKIEKIKEKERELKDELKNKRKVQTYLDVVCYSRKFVSLLKIGLPSNPSFFSRWQKMKRWRIRDVY